MTDSKLETKAWLPKALVWIGIAVATAITGRLLWSLNHHQDPPLGDWLVNYSTGFERRGLSGTLLMLVHQASGVSLPTLTWLVQFSCICVIATVIAVRFAERWANHWQLWVLLFVPTGIFYGISQPDVIGRKEVVLYLLIIVGYKVRNAALLSVEFALFLGLTVLTLLMHEGLIFFFSYLLLLFWLTSASRREAIRKALAFAAVSLVTFASIFFLSSGNGAAICQNIMQQGGLQASSCTITGIGLDYSFADAIRELALRIESFGYFQAYLPAAVLTLAPIIAYLLARKVRWSNILLMVAFTWIPSLALFAIADDWGRWIAIHATSTLLLVLLLPDSTKANVKRPYLRFFGFAAIGIATFALWGVTYAVGKFGWLPYLALALKAIGISA